MTDPVEAHFSWGYQQFVYAPSGAKVAVMNGQALDHAYLRLPGGSEAIFTSSGLNQYRQADWLGSARLGSSTTGAAVQASAYAPYGEAYQTWGGGLSFTGQNQDTVWNGTAALYDFPARRYSPTQQPVVSVHSRSTRLHGTRSERGFRTSLVSRTADFTTGCQGRWISPDPAGLAAVDPNDPQTWNRYAYVRNAPLAAVDPLGLKAWICGYFVICSSRRGDFEPPAQYGGDVGPLGPYDERPTAPMLRGGAGRTGQREKQGNVFTCASGFAEKYSLAGGLQALGIGTSGPGGFVANALGGNAFSGITALVASFASGAGGGHGVFYNMAAGVAAGPTQGLGAAFGRGIEGTVWAAGPSDVATAAMAKAAYSFVTGAGQTLQTLNGVYSLSSAPMEAAEFATGVGVLKILYDAASYGIGLVHCSQ